MDTKALSHGIRSSNLPESYVRPLSDRPTLSDISECENIPIIDLGCGDRSLLARQIGDACKFFGFFKVINHEMSLEAVEKVLKGANESFILPVEEKLKLYPPQKYVPIPAAQQILLPSVENQSNLWSMGTNIALASYNCRIASGSPFCEFEAYPVRISFLNIGVHSLIKDEYILMDLNGGFSNNDFRSASTGFYSEGELVANQKIKWVKCSKGGRPENIAPGRIRRLRRRLNKKDKDDEDDGEDNRRPSDSDFLSIIVLIVLILMLFLVVFSLIIWLMS